MVAALIYSDWLWLFRAYCFTPFSFQSVASMAGQITLLNAVDGRLDGIKIRTRIVRLWRHGSSHGVGDGNGIEMVLLDEEGNKIHATVKKIYASDFDGVLKEGSVYVISKFGVASNNTRFKMVAHQHKINFYRKTKVVEATGEFRGPLYGFNFVNYDSVLGCDADDNLAVDFIGVLRSCGKVLTKNVFGREGKLISFELESTNGKRVECALWDSLAYQLSDYVAQHKNCTPIIVIIHFGRITEFLGQPQITNCFYGTKVLIDVEIDEVALFRTRYLERNGTEAQNHGVLEYIPKATYSVVDDFLVGCPKKNIDELSDISSLGKYVIVGTIIAVRLEPTWYYLACRKCYGGVTEDDGSTTSQTPGCKTTTVGLWKCNKCSLRGVDAVRRFRIQIRVQDTTGTASLTLFDRDVFGVVKKTAEEIYAHLPKGEEDDILPVELKVLLGRIFAFKIDVSEFTLKTKGNVHTVFKMTDIPDVMSKLVAGYAVTKETPTCMVTHEESVIRDEGTGSSTDAKRPGNHAALEIPADGKRPRMDMLIPKKEAE